jgi:hypothetical protein
VFVCLNGFLGTLANNLFHYLDIYISFTLNLLSVLSLAATLITYALFKELRNLPGLNLMCLAATIFVSRVSGSGH